MALEDNLTLKNLTPPGYFNTLESAPGYTLNFIAWIDELLKYYADEVKKLRTLILTPWLVDWDDSGARTPYLKKKLSDYGFAFFGGNNTQAAYLYRLVSGSWSSSNITNFKRVLDAFCLPPFEWFSVTYIPRISTGHFVPSNFDTGFLVYSENPSPTTPPNTVYHPRAWVTPTGWTRSPSSSASYTRGYLSGGSIIWTTPRSVSDFMELSIFGASSVPLSVSSAGTVVIVFDDGSGDKNSIYFSDGSEWRKNSTPNADLGLVTVGAPRPDPEAFSVWAPNPATAGYAITSDRPPPTAGPTQGFGTFFTGSATAIFSGTLELQVEQIAGGDVAIATLLAVLRRVKPSNFVLTVKVLNALGEGELVVYNVSDMRAAPV